jgi:IclR family acetate operon transcriptional repressor
MTSTSPDRYNIPSVVKACQALRLMAEERTPITPSGLAKQLTMSRTTAYRTLRTFVHEGLVEEVADGYRLGTGMLRLALGVMDQLDVRKVATPVLRQLSERSGETSHLAVLASGKSLLVEVVDSPNPLRVASRPGALVDPYCCATGKVLLAHLPPDQQAALVASQVFTPRTPRTIVTADAFTAELSKVVSLGFALDDEEFITGARGLAAPVRDAAGRVCAAVGITAAASRFTPMRTGDMAALVMDSARQLSELIGWRRTADGTGAAPR